MNVYLVDSRSGDIRRDGSPGAFYSVRFFSASPLEGLLSLHVHYRTKLVFTLTTLQISLATALFSTTL
jgi:hypothetical protein